MRGLALAMTLLLAACGNTVSSLPYTSTAPIVAVSRPRIAAVTAVDQRKEEPNRLATIMGGFGNPIKTLDTAKPVKDEVADAFSQALQARGLLGGAGQAPFTLQLTIRKFDADMIIGRTARIDLTMVVADSAGRAVYQDIATDSESETKFFQTGVFADIADLKALSQTVLNRTVDRLLDKPAFLSAIAATRR